jgi:hypothetical protein
MKKFCELFRGFSQLDGTSPRNQVAQMEQLLSKKPHSRPFSIMFGRFQGNWKGMEVFLFKQLQIYQKFQLNMAVCNSIK